MLPLELSPSRPAGARRVARRRRAELAFLPAALEIVETPPSPTLRATAATLVLLVASGLVWASIGRIDIITTAQGRLVASGRTKVVQPYETGVVRQIDVVDGQRVHAGQTLVLLDASENEAQRLSATHDLLSNRLDAARLRALLAENIAAFVAPAGADPAMLADTRRLMLAQQAGQDAKLADLDHQAAEKRAELGEVRSELHRLDASMPMLQAHLRIRQSSIQAGSGNQLDYYDALRGVVDQQQQRVVEANKLDETGQSLASLLRQREAAVSGYRSGLFGDLAKTEAVASQRGADLVRATTRAGLQTLRAPVDGTVQQLALHTVGGVVTPAEPLLEIVPDGASLEVEARVPNRDVGFVHAGQQAEVKVEALEFTHYGLLHGNIVGLSSDAEARDMLQQDAAGGGGADKTGRGETGEQGQSDPDYIAHVALREHGLQTEQGFVPLAPGMTVTVEIKTGRRRVIDFLLSPLRELRHDALTER